MRKHKVFISQWMPEAGIELIQQHCEIDYHKATEPLEKQEFIQRAQDAEALVIFMSDTIDREVIDRCPRLRVISSFGKGYDNIDMDACTRNNVMVTINPDSLTDSTADMAMTLLLALCRNVIPADLHVRSKQFNGWHATNFLGKDFHHSKLGIVGLGAIGKAIAKRAKAFDADISYHDTVRSTEFEKQLGVNFTASLQQLLSENDFIILAVDFHSQNYHLIDETHLKAMKKGSILINICRGSIVDETAVSKALQQGHLWGYASDVFEFEDRLIPQRPDYIPQSLLQQTGRTVFTPHVGTGTVEARERLSISTAQQLLDALNGKAPLGLVR
ncbi:MAG: NAD(P)-dependent oxidoreductase [Bacillota bacterium]